MLINWTQYLHVIIQTKLREAEGTRWIIPIRHEKHIAVECTAQLVPRCGTSLAVDVVVADWMLVDHPSRRDTSNAVVVVFLSRSSMMGRIKRILLFLSKWNFLPSGRKAPTSRLLRETKLPLSGAVEQKNSIQTMASKKKPQITCLLTSASPRPTITCDLRHILFYWPSVVIYYFHNILRQRKLYKKSRKCSTRHFMKAYKMQRHLHGTNN